MEGCDTGFPEVAVIQPENFDHTSCLITVIDETFTTQDKGRTQRRTACSFDLLES